MSLSCASLPSRACRVYVGGGSAASCLFLLLSPRSIVRVSSCVVAPRLTTQELMWCLFAGVTAVAGFRLTRPVFVRLFIDEQAGVSTSNQPNEVFRVTSYADLRSQIENCQLFRLPRHFKLYRLDSGEIKPVRDANQFEQYESDRHEFHREPAADPLLIHLLADANGASPPRGKDLVPINTGRIIAGSPTKGCSSVPNSANSPPPPSASPQEQKSAPKDWILRIATAVSKDNPDFGGSLLGEWGSDVTWAAQGTVQRRDPDSTAFDAISFYDDEDALLTNFSKSSKESAANVKKRIWGVPKDKFATLAADNGFVVIWDFDKSNTHHVGLGASADMTEEVFSNNLKWLFQPFRRLHP